MQEMKLPNPPPMRICRTLKTAPCATHEIPIKSDLIAIGRVIVGLLLVLAVSGCQEPAEVVADHIEAMALIADEHKDDCPEMGTALNDYLTTHGDELEEHAAKLGESSKAQAQRIDVASRRLDEAVVKCESDASVQAFKASFSELVLRATGLK